MRSQVRVLYRPLFTSRFSAPGLRFQDDCPNAPRLEPPGGLGDGIPHAVRVTVSSCERQRGRAPWGAKRLVPGRRPESCIAHYSVLGFRLPVYVFRMIVRMLKDSNLQGIFFAYKMHSVMVLSKLALFFCAPQADFLPYYPFNKEVTSIFLAGELALFFQIAFRNTHHAVFNTK